MTISINFIKPKEEFIELLKKIYNRVNFNLLSLFVGTILTIQTAHATNYYVDPQGNDNNNGTSAQTPWRTISRVNQSAFSYQPGDSILFKAGSTFRGSVDVVVSGTANNPIVISTYGDGEPATLAGSVQVSNWTQWQGNIWRAALSQTPTYVFVDQQLQTLARYPNQGFLRINSSTSTTITDTDLNQPNGYWNGARLVLRSFNWSYFSSTITNHSNGTLTTATNLGLGNTNGQSWGYFLTNKLSELDMPGEWFHDGQFLYLWFPAGTTPNTSLVEAAVTQKGINVGWQRNHHKIDRLHLKHYTQFAIDFASGINLHVHNCTFTQNRTAFVGSSTNGTYINNNINQTYATAMLVGGSSNQIAYNQFTDIALHPGLGEDLWGYFGLRVFGSNSTIAHNRFVNIGYIPIVFEQGNNLTIEYNFIDGALATLNDGGGIAFDKVNVATVRRNIVRNMIGEFESSAPEYWSSYPLSMGIYFGNTNIKNVVVEENTVSDCTNIGIYIDHTMNSEGNVVRNNNLYNNGSGGGIPHRRGSQVRFSDHSNQDGENSVPPFYVPFYNNVFEGNVMASLSPLQDGLAFYQIHTSAFTNYGDQFDNNIYLAPFNNQPIVNWDHFSGLIPYRHTLPHWQVEEEKELNSIQPSITADLFELNQVVGPELVPNGTFDDNISGWYFALGQATLSNPDQILDGKCLSVLATAQQPGQRLLVKHNSAFNLQQGAYYQLSFTTKSDHYVDLQFGVKAPWQSWAPEQLTYNNNVGVTPGRQDHTFIFQSPHTTQARVFFRNMLIQPQYYIDNVSLRQVTVAQPTNPFELLHLAVNSTEQDGPVELPPGSWVDPQQGTTYTSAIDLQSFRSKILYRSTTYPLTVRVLLGGAYQTSTSSMRNDLQLQQLIPLQDPYQLGYTTTQQQLDQIEAVDWIRVNLINQDQQISVAGVVDRFGWCTLDVPAGIWTVVVDHRNHLAIASNQPIIVDQHVELDLTTQTNLFGDQSTKLQPDSVRTMWPGDINQDGQIKYVGANNDRDHILELVGPLITSVVAGYLDQDVNLDGVVKYTGLNNDRDVILQSIGGDIPTAIRNKQIIPQ